MADLNKVFLIGRLTHDPVLRRTPTTGSAVTDLRLATSRVYTTRDGQRKEEPLYIDITTWNRQAENCCEYLKKGSQVHVEGYLKMESWDDKTTGEKRSKIRVQAERVQFLDSRRGESGGMDGDYAAPAARDAAPSRRSNGSGFGGDGRGAGPAGRSGFAPPANAGALSPSKSPVGDDNDEEDIPF